MEEKVLFTMEAPYRQPLKVKGYFFGNPEKKTLAVVGSLRGNEVQQTYVCGLLIRALKQMEAEGRLSEDTGILVIPCINQFSMNVGRRFWAADNTDINRMFPGYDQGETTQRIAARLFDWLQGYTYGVHLISFYLPGNFLPHVRIMETGYERPQDAIDFGLPYVVLRKPKPYDTTTLNYNWQIWNTSAVSLYTRETDMADPVSAQMAVDGILRMMNRKGFCSADVGPGAEPEVFQEETLITVLTRRGGLLLHRKDPGTYVMEGETLGEIVDPCTAEVTEFITAPHNGTIFFAHRPVLINGHDVAYRIIPD